MSRRRGAAAALFAVVVAVSATIFGFGFVPKSDHDEGEGEHAEAVEGVPEEAVHAEEEDEGTTAGAVASAILISLAGVAVVPLALVAARRRSAAVLVAASLLSIGAAIVHFAVIAQHLEEWWLTGLFFASTAAFQLAWALLVLVRPSAPVYAAGAIVNALIVVTWIISRTTGVPVGPEAGEAEAVGFPDALSTAFEIALVALLTVLLAAGSVRQSAGRPRATVDWAVAVAVAALTGAALAMLA